MELTTQRTLPDHATCTTHARYLLSCADYEGLLTDCGRACQICRFPAERMPQGKLYIDHGTQGRWAVRGLLCIRCNSALGDRRQELTSAARAYLGSPWFARMLSAQGLSPDLQPEPGVGSEVADHCGRLWVREPCGSWLVRSRPPGAGACRPRIWSQLHRDFGPHNLRILSTAADTAITTERTAVALPTACDWSGDFPLAPRPSTPPDYQEVAVLLVDHGGVPCYAGRCNCFRRYVQEMVRQAKPVARWAAFACASRTESSSKVAELIGTYRPYLNKRASG